MRHISTFFSAFFRVFEKNLKCIRVCVFLLFVASSLHLFFCFPSCNGLCNYTWDDRCVAIFQVAKGQVSNIHGPDKSGWVQFSRLALPFCFLWGAIEIVIRIFIGFFTRFTIRRLLSGHVAIYGIGEKGFILAQNLIKHRHTVVVVDSNPANPYLEQLKSRGAYPLVGDANDIVVMKSLGLHRASAFYALTGSDTVNIESAIRLKEIFQEKKNYLKRTETLSAVIQVHDPILRRLVWGKDALLAEDSSMPFLYCYPFSVYDQAARVLVEKYSPDVQRKNTKPYNVLIVGFGWLGERTALQIIRMCQTPRSSHQKLNIFVIDDHADVNEKIFYTRYPAVDPKNKGDSRYGDYAPLANLTFIKGDIREMNEKTIRSAIPCDDISVAYVCLSDEELGTEVSMSLSKLMGDNGTKIVFALSETERLTNKMSSTFETQDIHLFFSLTESCSLHSGEKQLGETIDNMGKVVVKAYHASAKIDEIEKSWHEQEEWKRESNRLVACHVFFKLRMAGIAPEAMAKVTKDEIINQCRDKRELLAELEHDRWCAERLLDGWICGKKKDETKRLHPDIKPFNILDIKTQDIDRDINDIIPEMIEIWQKSVDHLS